MEIDVGDGSQAIFLDTTIRIAEIIHSPAIKRTIRQHLSQFEWVLTGLVVRQEFKRRLLNEAAYLLELIERKGTLIAVRRHLSTYLPVQQGRKKRICDQLLCAYEENTGASADIEQLVVFLRTLIKGGLAEFDGTVDCVIKESGCACSTKEIYTTRSGNFKRPNDKCSLEAGCKVSSLLSNADELCEKIELHLNQSSGKLTDELKQAVAVLAAYKETGEVQGLEPCLSSGDLLICLESRNCKCFYSMNHKESSLLCAAAEQDFHLQETNENNLPQVTIVRNGV